MNEPIITSRIDTDYYKLSMGQLVYHQYPNVQVKYEFRCRNKGVKLGFLRGQVRDQIDMLGDLRLTGSEESWMRNNLPCLTYDYIDYIKNTRMNPEHVGVREKDGDLEIYTNGLWAEDIPFEVPILSIVNELYFRHISPMSNELTNEGLKRLNWKIKKLAKHPRITMAEFGTRRRFSKSWQNFVFGRLVDDCPNVVGTSNVSLAHRFHKKAIGTMAHEYISAHLALVERLGVAQKRAMHIWLQEYGTNLGIALTDTFTTDAFLRDFDVVLAREFSGVRHDSGDPIEYGHKIIAHYKKLGIDPRTKVIVFSDGLDIPTAIKIFETFTGLIGISFGIGTNLTNDLGVTPLNIVMKLLECNGVPVVKLSDDAGKAIGDPDMIRQTRMAYGSL